MLPWKCPIGCPHYRIPGRKPPKDAGFDVSGFREALARAVTSRHLEWWQVAEATGVSPTVLVRIGQGVRPDVVSMAALCGWAGIDVERYMDPTPDAAPAPSQVPMERQVAWLIETTTGQYWCGGKYGWTPSPNLACRFARAEDAIAAREWLRIPPVDTRVTEHVWLDAAPAEGGDKP